MDQGTRQKRVAELVQLAESMVQGSFSQTFRTCGTPGCRCHRGEKHGPHTYLTFRTPKGRYTSLYVPQSELARFQEAVGAWNRFKELAAELARENRELLAQGRPKRPRRADKARKT